MFGSRLDEDGSTQALARNTFPAPPPHPAVRMDLDADPSVDGENSMDWTPLPPTPTSSSSRPKPHGARDTEREREGWVQLAPPRFFAPDKQEPTGLEGLFEKSLRVSGEVQGVGGGGKVRARARERWWKVW